jgi:hypothetical protein
VFIRIKKVCVSWRFKSKDFRFFEWVAIGGKNIFIGKQQGKKVFLKNDNSNLQPDIAIMI